MNSNCLKPIPNNKTTKIWLWIPAQLYWSSRCIKKTASVTLFPAFLRLQEKSASTSIVWWTSFTVKFLMVDQQVEIIWPLLSTLAVFLRKSELVNLQCGSHKSFKRPIRIKGKEKYEKFKRWRHMSKRWPIIGPYHFPTHLIWWDSPFKETVARDLFTEVVSWIFSLGGLDFKAKRISTFVLYSQRYFNFSRVPCCSLQRRFLISSVAHSGDFESPL